MTNHEPPPGSDTESTVDRQIPGAPSDGATLTEMLNSLAEEGFEHQFTPAERATVECAQCATRFDASSLDVVSMRRLEGASDPDDMMSLVAARCPNCDASGTLLLGYGVNASVDDADIARALNVPDQARETPIMPPSTD